MPPAKPGVEVVEAATVLCLRARPDGPSPRELRAGNYALNKEAQKQLGEFAYNFRSGMQVLMGQSEVVNWVRSTPEEHTIMRYAGEYKFAGGSKDPGEELIDTARRELSEEFSVNVPLTAVLRPFRVNSTRAIKGRSFLMYNYLAFADENPWLQELDTAAINRALQEKREHFERLVSSGRFWAMSKEEREAVSPEVHRVDWLDLADAADGRMRGAPGKRERLQG